MFVCTQQGAAERKKGRVHLMEASVNQLDLSGILKLFKYMYV